MGEACHQPRKRTNISEWAEMLWPIKFSTDNTIRYIRARPVPIYDVQPTVKGERTDLASSRPTGAQRVVEHYLSDFFWDERDDVVQE